MTSSSSKNPNDVYRCSYKVTAFSFINRLLHCATIIGPEENSTFQGLSLDIISIVEERQMLKQEDISTSACSVLYISKTNTGLIVDSFFCTRESSVAIVVKSKTEAVEFGRDFHRQHSPMKKYDVGFSFNRRSQLSSTLQNPLPRSNQFLMLAPIPGFPKQQRFEDTSHVEGIVPYRGTAQRSSTFQ